MMVTQKQLLITATLLLIPFIASIFNSEVNWGIGDYLIAAGILTLGIIAYNQLSHQIDSPDMRLLGILLIVFILFLLWSEFAVGIFDSAIGGS